MKECELTPYTWLILDADGTLFDFQRAEAIALKNTPDQMGVQVPGNFSSAYHVINDSLWRDFEAGILCAQDVRSARFRLLFERLNLVGDSNAFSEAFLTNLVQESTFIEGAESLLARLEHRIGLVLLTNGFADVQHARIARLGLEEVFDHVIISEEVGAAKPDRAVFDIVFERMGSPNKGSVLIVGDSLSSDIRGGADYGIDTCWFNPDLQANMTRIGPTFEIRHLSDVADLLFRAKGQHE
jgi:2-haloacid dehalogenase